MREIAKFANSIYLLGRRQYLLSSIKNVAITAEFLTFRIKKSARAGSSRAFRDDGPRLLEQHPSHFARPQLACSQDAQARQQFIKKLREDVVRVSVAFHMVVPHQEPEDTSCDRARNSKKTTFIDAAEVNQRSIGIISRGCLNTVHQR